MKKSTTASLLLCLILLLLPSGFSAVRMAAASPADVQASTSPHTNDMPLIVYVRSRYCPVCAKVSPIIDKLEPLYRTRARFLTLDVSDSKSKEESRKIAKSLQLGAFFAMYEDTYPCVGIFDRHRKCLKELYGANPKDQYTAFIDKAIETK